MCIGGDTRLFSCTEDRAVSARDVSVGDRVRALRSSGDGNGGGESVCSDVYYVFSHGEEDDGEEDASAWAILIGTSPGGGSLTVSYDHLVYVGESVSAPRDAR